MKRRGGKGSKRFVGLFIGAKRLLGERKERMKKMKMEMEVLAMSKLGVDVWNSGFCCQGEKGGEMKIESLADPSKQASKQTSDRRAGVIGGLE